MQSPWKAIVDKERCIGCGSCTRVCPQGAIELIPISNIESEERGERLQKLKGQIGTIEMKLDKIRKNIRKIKR